jgi:hypothetical protein
MVRTTITLLALALALSGCGVDRVDTSSVRVMFSMDEDLVGRGGGASRDARGVFDLQGAGVYLAVTATGEDMEPVVEDWPETEVETIPAQVELTMTVKAGSDRTFEGLVLVLDDAGALSVYTGSRTVDELPGGAEWEMDPPLALEERATTTLETVLALPDGLDVDDVHSVHPVDAQLDVRYPEAVFSAVGADLEVSVAALPPGRTVGWSVYTSTAEWVDLEQETDVP